MAFQSISVVKKIRGLLGSYKEGEKKEKKERILEKKKTKTKHHHCNATVGIQGLASFEGLLEVLHRIIES